MRAIAVVPVVLYHFGVWPFSGGYVGVDVFFVISGYLITSLIHGEMQDGRFSIVNFYERRVRRIFPALFAMLAVTAIASLIALFPNALIAFGKSLLATAVFVSNFQFWSEAGYFDAAASQKPLLHTWSLAVEEQFYLLFPGLLLLLRGADRKRLLASSRRDIARVPRAQHLGRTARAGFDVLSSPCPLLGVAAGKHSRDRRVRGAAFRGVETPCPRRGWC